MTTTLERSSRQRRNAFARVVFGSLVELGIKSYGAGAATAVALSSGETTSAKARDAVAAVPTLTDEYHHARYVVQHREEIDSALVYLNEHSPTAEELQRNVADSTETIGNITTTYDEVARAKDAFHIGLGDAPDPVEAYEHIRAALSAKPSDESIHELADAAGQLPPLMDQVDVLMPIYYGGFLNASDNFAHDELWSTIGVMAAAVTIAFVLGRAIGFWIRRGQPRLIARLLQGLGSRVFRRWYAHNLPWAMGRSYYATAHAHLRREIMSDPELMDDPAARSAVERYFATRAARIE